VTFPHTLDLAQIGIMFGVELRVDNIPQPFLQQFFYAVTQQTRWNGIDRQEPAFKVVDAQQVLAVLDQIAIPVFVFFQIPPDRVPRDWRSLREVPLPFPRVQCHGSPLVSGPPGIM
jgi:hypothetical protein